MDEKAAVKIQASFRGFYVRQCQPLRKLRQIADVRTKLKKLKMRACDPVYIDRLCVNPMENRKMKEEIMALLLELDSVQGVLPVVRKIRKSVTRDVVQFQEIVDAVKVDSVARNDAEEVAPRPSAATNLRPSEQAIPRAGEQVNPRANGRVTLPLRRVMSLDNNCYPEQSYVHQLNKKKASSDGAAVDGYYRSSDDDAAPRRRPDGSVKIPFLGRSTSGNHKGLAGRTPVLKRTVSEIQRNVAVRNPLLGRSISEVVRKHNNPNSLLGRSISEVQRKRSDIVDTPPVTTGVPDVHRSPNPETPPISNDRVSSADLNSPPGRQKSYSFDRQEAAILIQSAYRGHLSRRSQPLQHLRNISVVNDRLRELNLQLVDPTCVERLRTDGMERLKWSEEITALLLKLDSVQGVVQAIRDIRKSVTREVIKLQEKVDNLSVNDETDDLSRMGDVYSDSSVETTERFGFSPNMLALSGMPIPDQESLDKNVGLHVGDSSPKASAILRPFCDSPFWDDKYMYSQERRLEEDCDLSPGTFSGERGTNEGELQPDQARVQRNLKRVQSGSIVWEATGFHKGDNLSSGRFPAEDGTPLNVSSSSESAAASQADGEPQLLVNDGELDSQHASLARIQKKLKRIQSERIQTGAVDPDLDSSVAGIQDQVLARNSNGLVDTPVEAILEGISLAVKAPLSGKTTGRAYSPNTTVPMLTSDDSSPSPRQADTDSDSNDVPMLHGDYPSNVGHQRGQHGRSSRQTAPCGRENRYPEERARQFLRSRAGHCEVGTGIGQVSHGQVAIEDNLPTTSEAPAVHSSEDHVQREDDPVMELECENSRLNLENARLKVLLHEVLGHAEHTALELKATKVRLAKLEKERVQHTKKEDTGVRKKAPYNRRRR